MVTRCAQASNTCIIAQTYKSLGDIILGKSFRYCSVYKLQDRIQYRLIKTSLISSVSYFNLGVVKLYMGAKLIRAPPRRRDWISVPLWQQGAPNWGVRIWFVPLEKILPTSLLLLQRTNFCVLCRNIGYFLCGLEREKCFVNVHLHCIVSNLKRIAKCWYWKVFCGRPWLWLLFKTHPNAIVDEISHMYCYVEYSVPTMQLPQHYTCKTKHHFPYTAVPTPHEWKQLHESECNSHESKWFQTRIPSRHRDK